MTKHRYTATFKRKDETVFTKTFLASDLFEADEQALEYATKRDILYLDLGYWFLSLAKNSCSGGILIEGIKTEIVDKKEIKC